MKTLNHKIFYVKNPVTGEFESMAALRGESAYQAAVRLGLTTLTEEQWLKEYIVKRDDAMEAIEDKGQEVLDSIPDDYHEINERVQQTIDKTPIVTHDNGSYYVLDSTDVDNTLSVSGKVADAKVTGEKISQLSEEFDVYTNQYNIVSANSFEFGYYTAAVVGEPPTWNKSTAPIQTRLSTPIDKAVSANAPIVCSIKDGYRLVALQLDANDNFVKSSAWLTKENVLPGGYKYVFALAAADDGEIGIADVTKIKIATVDDAFANRAHIAGDTVNLLGLCRWVNGNVYNDSNNQPYIDFGSSNRIAPIDVFTPSAHIELSVDSGYKYFVFTLDANGETANVSGWLTGSTTLSAGVKYRLIMANTSDSTIAPEEFCHLHVSEVEEVAYAAETEAVINSVLADKDLNTLTFALITDTHNNITANRRTAKHGEMLGAMADRVGAAFSIHLGDVSEGAHSTLEINQATIAEFWAKMNIQHTPVLYTIAHHEMYGAQGVSGWEKDPTAPTASNCMGMYGYTTKHLDIVKSDDGLSWYADVCGVRCIGLDSCSNGPYGYSQAVADFLAEALETENKVILFAHVAPFGEVMTNSSAPTNGDLIISKLDTHAQSEILAFFHGHTHWDNVYTASDGVRYISTCCALPERVSEELFCSAGNPTAYDRTIGTYTEYCFDVVNVHLDTGIIRTFRFGAGNNREIE